MKRLGPWSNASATSFFGGRGRVGVLIGSSFALGGGVLSVSSLEGRHSAGESKAPGPRPWYLAIRTDGDEIPRDWGLLTVSEGDDLGQTMLSGQQQSRGESHSPVVHELWVLVVGGSNPPSPTSPSDRS